MREEKKMQISSRFTIATHMLIVLALEGKKQKLTSDILAGSVGVNPVIIRKTLSQLKNAGMITVARGTGGAEIAKDLKDWARAASSLVFMISPIQTVLSVRTFTMS